MTKTTANKPAAQLACPTCKAAIEWSDKFPYRPFCSERCRLIDLGSWANEENRIAGSPIYEDLYSGDLESH